MNLKLKITIALGLLFIIAGFCSVWMIMDQSQVMHNSKANQYKDRILVALNGVAKHQALERGIGNAIIGGGKGLEGKIQGQRTKGDRFLIDAKEAIEDYLEFEVNDDIETRYKAFLAGQDKLLKNRQLLSNGTIDSKAWLGQATENIRVHNFGIKSALFLPKNELQTVLYYNSVVQPQLQWMAEYLGLTRAKIGKAIAQNKTLDAKSARGIYNLIALQKHSASILIDLEQMEFIPENIQKKISQFKKTYSAELMPMINKIMNESEKETPEFPITPGEWIEISTKAIDEGLDIGIEMSLVNQSMMDEIISSNRTGYWMSVFVFVLALLISLAGFWFFTKKVLVRISLAKDVAMGVSDSAQTMNSELTNVASSVEELIVVIKEISQNGERAANNSVETVKNATESAEAIRDLKVSADAINEVLETIKQIADRTDLLALNATIEAASAGEAGRGFAVVANEVQQLASKTAKATSDITARISSIQGDLEKNIDLIVKVRDSNQEIEESSTSLAASIEEFTLTVENINQSIYQTTDLTSQVTMDIQGVSDEMETLISGK